MKLDLTSISCITIVLLFIFVFWKLFHVNIRLKEIWGCFNPKEFRPGRDIKETIIITNDTVINSVDRAEHEESKITKYKYYRAELDSNRKLYYQRYAQYVSLSQLISIFPLLGILGTVLGLVASRDMANIEQLVSGLSTAMLTTLVGLIASIALKLYDTQFPGKKINELEAEFMLADAYFQQKAVEESMLNIKEEMKNGLLPPVMDASYVDVR